MSTMGMMEPLVHWVNGEDSNAVFAAALVLLCCFYKEIHGFLQRWCAWWCRWTRVGDVKRKQLSSRNIAQESSSLASTTTPASPSSSPPTPRRPSLLRASSSRRSCSLLSPLSARRQSSEATRLVGTTEERPSVSWEDHSSTASTGAGQQQAQQRQPTRLEILQNLERRHTERETSETSEVSPIPTLSPPNSPIHKPSRSLQQKTPPPLPQQRQRMDLSKSETRMSRFISSPATTSVSRQASQRRGSLAEYMQVKRKLQRTSFSRRSSITNHHRTAPKLVEEERECPETHSY